MPDGTKHDRRRTVLLTLGRLPPALDLARAYAKRGCRVIVAEPFGMHLCRMSRSVTKSLKVTSPEASASRYLDDLESVVREEKVELVVPVSEETPRVAQLHERLSGVARIFSSTHERLIELHDKFRFARLAERLGYPVASTWGEGDAMPASAPTGLVRKPRYSCSGRGVTFLEEPPASLQPGDIIQARLRGEEVSGFACVVDGQITAWSAYRALVLSGSVAVAFERIESPDVESWMRGFVEAIGYTGFIAFDFILDDQGRPTAIECNPRASSGIHFISEQRLAPYVDEPRDTPANLYEDSRAMTESWSCYTAVLSALPDLGAVSERLGQLRRSRDVTWKREDPWPFLLAPVNTASIIGRAIRKRSNFAEVAVGDLEWRPADFNAT